MGAKTEVETSQEILALTLRRREETLNQNDRNTNRKERITAKQMPG